MELLSHHKQSSKGDLSNNIEVKYGPVGRGIFANGTVHEGDALLRLDPEQLITPNHALEVPPTLIYIIIIRIVCSAIMGPSGNRRAAQRRLGLLRLAEFTPCTREYVRPA